MYENTQVNGELYDLHNILLRSYLPCISSCRMGVSAFHTHMQIRLLTQRCAFRWNHSIVYARERKLLRKNC